MIAGTLRHRITIERPSGTQDAVGQKGRTWTAVATLWAAVLPMSVRELFLAEQAHSAVTHRVRVRHDSTIAAADASWRILFGDRVLDILGKRNIDERNVEIEFLCVEGLKS